MSTNNLKAYSNSSMFTGKGTVNLNNDRVDLRIKLAKLKRFMKWLNLPRKIFNEFPILDGAVKYKLYGQMDKLKVRPDPGGGS